MIEIDADKLIDILDSDIKKLEKACILSFDSSSDKFIEPILKRQIGVNNKPLGTDKIELDFDFYFFIVIFVSYNLLLIFNFFNFFSFINKYFFF